MAALWRVQESQLPTRPRCPETLRLSVLGVVNGVLPLVAKRPELRSPKILGAGGVSCCPVSHWTGLTRRPGVNNGNEGISRDQPGPSVINTEQESCCGKECTDAVVRNKKGL